MCLQLRQTHPDIFKRQGKEEAVALYLIFQRKEDKGLHLVPPLLVPLLPISPILLPPHNPPPSARVRMLLSVQCSRPLMG